MAGAFGVGGSKRDIGWKYNFLEDPRDPNAVTCKFCGQVSKGGIYRAKQHQVGKFRNVRACLRCPEKVKEELLNQLTTSKISKSGISGSSSNSLFSEDLPDDDDHEMEYDSARSNEKRSGSTFENEVRKRLKHKTPPRKGPMDLFLMEKGKAKETSVVDTDDKIDRSTVIQSIARWFYEAGIPFSAVKLKSFKEMINAIGIYGPNLKPPSIYEMRVTLLKREVALTKEMMKDHVASWSRYGCSIVSDSWTDGKQRCIINFLVSGVKGTVFIKSVDASAYFKTGEKLFELLDSFVEEIGEKNVLQVVTDNGDNYMSAGKLLMAKRQRLYWTSSVAHCINSIIEDIGKLPNIKKAIQKAIFLVGFIYNHGSVLSTMRTYTKNKELVRHGITKFVTTILNLQRLHILKKKLKKMFKSQEWKENKLSTTKKGNKARELVLSRSFWSLILFALRVMSPLVSVLRLVYNEKKPAMGCIYDAMDMAKKTILESFIDEEDNCADVFKIIDERWNSQLLHPLYAAGHFLNPAYFDRIFEGQIDPEVTSGLYACIEKLAPTVGLQDKILTEIACYKRSEGIFDMALVNRSRKLRPPAEWWDLFGHSTPNLQRLAVRILSLTCSAIGCEHNWSLFEHIHFTKKMNRLEHRRILDSMYVKYNHKLKDRYNAPDTVDPLCVDDIDDSNEWMVGEMDDEVEKCDELVFHDDEEVYSDYEEDTEVQLGNDILLEEDVDLYDDYDYDDFDLGF